MADITREQIVFELQAEVSAAQAKVDRFTQAIERAQKSSGKVGANLKNGLAGAQKQLNLTTKQLKQYEAATKKASSGSTFLYTQVGYLASDARYGLLGMGNNLSIVAVGLQQMSQRAKETGSSLSKELRKGLVGGGGILLGIQILIALLPEIIKLFQSWTGSVNELDDALKQAQKEIIKTARPLEFLQNKINENNLSLKDRVATLKDLEKAGVSVRTEDGAWLTNLNDINTAIDEQMVKIRQRAQIKILWDKVVKKEEDILANKEAAVNVDKTGWDRFLNHFTGGLYKEIKEGNVGELESEIEIFIKKIDEITRKKNQEVELPTGPIDIDRLVIRSLGTTIDEASKGLADAVLRIRKRASERLKEKEEEEFQDSLLFSQEDVDAASGAVDYAESLYNIEEDPEFKALVEQGQALRAEKEYWQEVYKSDAQIAADQELAALKLQLDRKLITEEQFQAASERIKRKAITNEIKMRGQQLQQLGSLLKKGGAIQIAGVVVEQGAALFDVVKGVQGRIKAIKNLPDPTGVSQSLLIAKAVGEGVLEGGVITATAAKSIQQIKQASGASGGSGGGANTSGPRFNIIGQNSNNALQATIEEQTGAITNGQGDQRVVLVQSELEVKQNDQQVAVETATL